MREFLHAIRGVITKKKKFFVILITIELLTLFKIILPFIRQNNLQVVDMIGHYFSAWYIKEYLFPWPFGWNPFFYAGFPQGQFYPFLFHYISAILSFLFPLEIAFKLLLSFTFLITPLSFYYFAKKFDFNYLESSLVMLWMWLLLFIPKSYLVGTIFATFHLGTVTAMLGTPLFFFYLGKLKESVRTNRYLGASILLSLIILTHFFTTFVVLLTFLIFLVLEARGKKELIFFLKHGFLSFLLTSFWLFPFLFKLNYTRPTKIVLMDTPLLIVLVLFFCCLVVLYSLSNELKRIKLILALCIILILLMTVRDYLPLTFHYYRLLPFVILFIPISIVCIVSSKFSILKGIITIPPLFIAIILTFSSLFSLFQEVYSADIELKINSEGVQEMIYEFGNVDGRILVLPFPGTVPSFHVASHLIPLNTRNQALRGLFGESSLHERYVSLIYSEFIPQSTEWSIFQDKPISEKEKLLPFHLKTFAVSYILASENLNYSNALDNDSEIKILSFHSNEANKLMGFFSPFIIIRQIKANVLSYFQSKGEPIILIHYYSPKFSQEIKILNKTKDYIKFEIKSEENVPIFISSVFSYWRCYVNGHEVQPIFKDENMSIFYANGTIELKYEKSLLNLLNITFAKPINIHYKNQTFYLYNISSDGPKLIEILNYTPTNIAQEWDENVWNWFNSPGNISKIIVESKTPLPKTSAIGNETIEILNISRTWEYLKFSVNSKEPVPILIKISEFPNWKAYVNGKETEIYRASPYMMLIYGKGIVELKYEPILIDYVGLFLSVIGVIWCLFTKFGNK